MKYFGKGAPFSLWKWNQIWGISLIPKNRLGKLHIFYLKKLNFVINLTSVYSIKDVMIKKRKKNICYFFSLPPTSEINVISEGKEMLNLNSIHLDSNVLLTESALCPSWSSMVDPSFQILCMKDIDLHH